jgi:molybdopterin-guanine dinucleotide biosynthesis protein A
MPMHERDQGYSGNLGHPVQSRAVTLGILAGGRATRLGGIDKAWIQRDGVPQVLRIAQRFAPAVECVLISTHRDPVRHAEHGWVTVADLRTGLGPIGGLQALAGACSTDWLLTIPVDLVGVNECLLPSLQSASVGNGAYAEDDDGLQPLVALWRVDALRAGAADAIDRADLAVHALQLRLGLAGVRFDGVRFGNLNTADDLKAGGFSTP